MYDVLSMAVPECLKDLPHVMAVRTHPHTNGYFLCENWHPLDFLPLFATKGNHKEHLAEVSYILDALPVAQNNDVKAVKGTCNRHVLAYHKTC